MQLFAQSPRAWRFPEHDPADLERFRERRAEAGSARVLVHALYLVNLATPDDDALREERRRRCARRSTPPCAIERGRRRLPRRLAPRRRASRPGSSGACPRSSRCSSAAPTTTWLLLENSAGAGGTIGRSVEELAALVDALDRHPRLGVCLDSCHLCVSGVDVRDPDGARPRARARSTRRSASTGCARCTSTTPRRRSARTATGTRTSARARSASGSASFLAHPALQGLPALLETPGPDGHGPDAAEVQKLRDLHAPLDASGGAAER